jgi:hypothetical protein
MTADRLDAEWVLVPRVPTRQMLRAAAKAMSPDRRPTTEWMSVSEKHAARYRAMIDAAPQRDPA